MAEWFSYALGDLLMFSSRTFFRLTERSNGLLWPLQPLILALSCWLLWSVRRPTSKLPRLALPLLAAMWLVTAWSYLHHYYAEILPAAEVYALAFLVEALLLGVTAARRVDNSPPLSVSVHRLSLMLIFYGAICHPAVSGWVGGDWPRVELAAIAPDPTVIVTLGLLLRLDRRERMALLPIPFAWLLVSGLTYLAMAAWQAVIAPIAMGLVVLALWLAHRSCSSQRE